MRTREFILMVYITDILLLNISISGVSYLTQPSYSTEQYLTNPLVWVFNITWTLIYLFFIDDSKPFKKSLFEMTKNVISRLTSFLALMSLVVFVLEWDKTIFSKDLILLNYLTFSVLIVLKSLFIFFLFSSYLTKGKSPILLVGSYKDQSAILSYVREKVYLGYFALGILTDDSKDLDKGDVLGTLDDFQKVYNETPFNDVVISLPLHERGKIDKLMKLAEKNGVRPRLIPNWGSSYNRKFSAGMLGDTVSILDIRRVPLYAYPNRFWKRAFDLLLASMGLLSLSPVLILIAIWIKFDSKGPIFYRPTRLGVNGKPFVVYKFRSMKDSDELQGGTMSTVENDERITKLGKVLRKSNLDELPQLINVLKNEMSIVGPRPHRIYLNQKLKEKMSAYMVRHFVKPGITGWAQVNGWRGPTETKIQYQGRTLHDLWYVENWSFWLDIYIICLTVFGKNVKKNAF